MRFLTVTILVAAVGVAVAAFGCAGKRLPGDEAGAATQPTTEPADLSESPEPPPVQAWEARAYLDRVLQDDSRVVEVFTNETQFGLLDEYGRKKLREALPGWWQTVFLDTPGRPVQVQVDSPNMSRQGPGAPGQGTHRRTISAGQAAKYFYLPTTSEMGIRVYAKGTSAIALLGPGHLGPPVATMQVFKQRGIARLRIADPDDERLSAPVYIIESADPIGWVDRVFAGKL